MKRKSILLLLIIMFGVSVHTAYAITLAPTIQDAQVFRASKSAQRDERVQVRSEKKVMKLNDRAELEINRRIASLQKLIDRVKKIKKLTDAQKSSLTSEVQSEIDSLNSLGTKIKSDTDTQTLKSDVQQVIKSHRVYALLMPKLEVIAAADRIINIADEIISLSSAIQTRIYTAKAAGNNVTALQGLIADITAKANDAKLQANNAINAVITLKPQGYPENASSLKLARKMIQAGHQDLVTAHHDAQIIKQGLKGFENKSTVPTSK